MGFEYNLAGLFTAALVIASSFNSDLRAQGITDPDSLAKNSSSWTQEERELGFRYFDQVFEAREIAKGDYVREIPQGLPITAFAKGGDKALALEEFIEEQKVAGLLIMQDGNIRLERYELGLSDESKWTSHSVAKSVTSTLVGAAIKDGYISSVDDYVATYIPDLEGSAYDSVTIEQMLTMRSGVRWRETYGDPESDLGGFFTKPLEPGVDRTVSYMRGLPAEFNPGERWVYSTGETHLLGVLVSSATGKTLSDYLSEKIWVPYGMESGSSWILNGTGSELAGCCLQAHLRDFGRYGQFALEGGFIDGESIVPDDWFEEATRSHVKLWGTWGYGYQWWTFDDGSFRALGIHGQMIHIDPARKLVVVVVSAWPEAESMTRHMAAENFLKMVTAQIDAE